MMPLKRMRLNEEATKSQILKELKIIVIILPNGEYRLGAPVLGGDEGAFYTIDGTHIIDKHKIGEIRKDYGCVEINMADKKVILEADQ